MKRFVLFLWIAIAAVSGGSWGVVRAAGADVVQRGPERRHRGYVKDDWSVWYRGRKVEGPVASSFSDLGGGYGKDAWTEYSAFLCEDRPEDSTNVTELLKPPEMKEYTAVDFRERNGEELPQQLPLPRLRHRRAGKPLRIKFRPRPPGEAAQIEHTSQFSPPEDRQSEVPDTAGTTSGKCPSPPGDFDASRLVARALPQPLMGLVIAAERSMMEKLIRCEFERRVADKGAMQRLKTDDRAAFPLAEPHQFCQIHGISSVFLAGR